MTLHRIIEIVNDQALAGIGIISVDSDWSVRSLLGLFYQKEEREISTTKTHNNSPGASHNHHHP